MTGPATQQQSLPLDTLTRREARIDELQAEGALEPWRHFAMRFFHGIESAVKARSATHEGWLAYEAVKNALQGRTLVRGAAFQQARDGSAPVPSFDEAAWQVRGLGIAPEALEGFAQLLESCAQAASEIAGCDATACFERAFLGFVELDVSVREAVPPGAPPESGRSLGGEPDSAHYFSFSELALWRLEKQPRNSFWLALARATVAAQPRFLALHFRAARRVPRTAYDYGPHDILDAPKELRRRRSAAPESVSMAQATREELAALVGRHAAAGLIGAT